MDQEEAEKMEAVLAQLVSVEAQISRFKTTLEGTLPAGLRVNLALRKLLAIVGALKEELDGVKGLVQSELLDHFPSHTDPDVGKEEEEEAEFKIKEEWEEFPEDEEEEAADPFMTSTYSHSSTLDPLGSIPETGTGTRASASLKRTPPDAPDDDNDKKRPRRASSLRRRPYAEPEEDSNTNSPNDDHDPLELESGSSSSGGSEDHLHTYEPMEDEPIKLLQTNRGKPMLARGDYLYRLVGTGSNNKKIWECEARRNRNKHCRARLHTSESLTDPVLLGVLGTHSHPPRPEGAFVKETITKLKAAALANPTEPLSNLISLNLPDPAELAKLPSIPSIKRTIQNSRGRRPRKKRPDSDSSSNGLRDFLESKGRTGGSRETEYEEPPDQPLKLIQSNQGRPMLARGGYLYRLVGSGSSNKKIWECEARRSRNCRVRLHTSESLTSDPPQLLASLGTHSHPPRPQAAVIVKERITKLKAAALANPTEPLSNLLSQGLNFPIPEDPVEKAKAKVPSILSIKRTIQNARRGLLNQTHPERPKESPSS